jgi:methyl-accepting chemotaxis protein
VQEQNWAQLTLYLQAFQDQSDLDVLLFCDVDSLLRAGQPIFDRCPAPGITGFALAQAQPALLVSTLVEDDSTNARYGVAVTGRWLDERFLRQIAADTGAQQSILSPDGVRLVSSSAGAIGTAASAQNRQGRPRGAINIGGRQFFTASSTLADGSGTAVLRVEVALLVDDLVATENRALAILVTSTGLIALVGVAVAIWYIRLMTRPLGQLTRIAREIAQGNFVAPIPTFSGPLEVSTLAGALQRSHARMRQALDELVQARDWLNNLIQSIVEGVIIFDNRRRITF